MAKKTFTKDEMIGAALDVVSSFFDENNIEANKVTNVMINGTHKEFAMMINFTIELAADRTIVDVDVKKVMTLGVTRGKLDFLKKVENAPTEKELQDAMSHMIGGYLNEIA